MMTPDEERRERREPMRGLNQYVLHFIEPNLTTRPYDRYVTEILLSSASKPAKMSYWPGVKFCSIGCRQDPLCASDMVIHRCVPGLRCRQFERKGLPFRKSSSTSSGSCSNHKTRRS